MSNMKLSEVIIFFFIWWGGGGVLGNRMLNPEVLKCHEDFITLGQKYNKEKQWIIMLHIYGYLGLGRGGGGYPGGGGGVSGP